MPPKISHPHYHFTRENQGTTSRSGTQQWTGICLSGKLDSPRETQVALVFWERKVVVIPFTVLWYAFIKHWWPQVRNKTFFVQEKQWRRGNDKICERLVSYRHILHYYWTQWLGKNWLSRPWVRCLAKLNKCFWLMNSWYTSRDPSGKAFFS